MKKDPKILYQEVILRHNKAPVRYQKMEGAQHHLDAYNPICGDRFSIFLEVANGVISAIHFHGYGCTISKASTSVMVEQLQGKTVEEAMKISKRFLAMIQHKDDEEAPLIRDESLLAFAPARDFPGRDSCATLSWDELLRFLQNLHS